MGLLSKVWKGIKKVGKGIVKGIKRTFKKVAGFFGKFGILGQIGMMFLMPYATAALGSMFGATGTLSQWSSTLLSKSGMGAKALGHGLNLINRAGTAVGKVYTTLSDTIGNAVDRVSNFAKGKGFTLSEGRQSVFFKEDLSKAIKQPTEFVGPPKPTYEMDIEAIENIKPDYKTASVSVSGPQVEAGIFDKPSLDVESFEAPKIDPFEDLDLGKPSLEVPEMTTTESLLEKQRQVTRDVRQQIRDIDVKDVVESGVKSGLSRVVTAKTAEAFGVENKAGDFYQINLPGMSSASSSNQSVYNTVDLTLQSKGNPYMANSIRNMGYMDTLVDPSKAYRDHMARFSASAYLA